LHSVQANDDGLGIVPLTQCVDRRALFRPAGEWAAPNFSDIFFSNFEIYVRVPSESQNETVTAMVDASGGAEIGAGVRGRPRRSDETAARGVRILERLAAGLPLAEIAALEGVSPRRARELLAEVVARRGFDP
jgi:hypothetical protein